MSSFVRRLEIRIAKKLGYVRQTQGIKMNPTTNLPEIIKLKRGPIIRPDGTSTGFPFWPKLSREAAFRQALASMIKAKAA